METKNSNQQLILQEKRQLLRKEVSVSDLLNAKPIKAQLRIMDKDSVLDVLIAIISKGVNEFSTNSTMGATQIAQFAKDFLLLNDHESFEDLIYTFQLMRNGYYGDFMIIDQAVVMDKFKKTLELKYQEKERFMSEESKRHNVNNDKLTSEEVLNSYRKKRDEVIRKMDEEKLKPQIEKKNNEDRRLKYLEHLKMYAHSYNKEQLIAEKKKLEDLGFTEHLEIINKYLK